MFVEEQHAPALVFLQGLERYREDAAGEGDALYLADQPRQLYVAGRLVEALQALGFGTARGVEEQGFHEVEIADPVDDPGAGRIADIEHFDGQARQGDDVEPSALRMVGGGRAGGAFAKEPAVMSADDMGPQTAVRALEIDRRKLVGIEERAGSGSDRQDQRCGEAAQPARAACFLFRHP